MSFIVLLCFFFFNDTATTEIYTLSLHDALPISSSRRYRLSSLAAFSLSHRDYSTGSQVSMSLPTKSSLLRRPLASNVSQWRLDRKSTRLNSSHLVISYAVFCLKKKKRRTD